MPSAIPFQSRETPLSIDMAVTPATNYSNSTYYKSSILGKIFSKYRANPKQLSFETYVVGSFDILDVLGVIQVLPCKVDSGLFKAVNFFC